ncbi:MAG: DUF3568 domain-containing protein [Syntrophales bacterium]|nr:DUF3568 domain-containing protein [Syntrophales bacterium]
MRRGFGLFIGLFFLLGGVIGCAAVAVGTGIVGSGLGTYYYVKGELRTDYYASFEKVWEATEKTVAVMGGIDVVPEKRIGYGSISSTISGEKVVFKVNYKDKNVTTVGVRVGAFGDERAAKRLHGKISDFLRE